jgi:hypothetical protein
MEIWKLSAYHSFDTNTSILNKIKKNGIFHFIKGFLSFLSGQQGPKGKRLPSNSLQQQRQPKKACRFQFLPQDINPFYREAFTCLLSIPLSIAGCSDFHFQKLYAIHCWERFLFCCTLHIRGRFLVDEGREWRVWFDEDLTIFGNDWVVSLLFLCTPKLWVWALGLSLCYYYYCCSSVMASASSSLGLACGF